MPFRESTAWFSYCRREMLALEVHCAPTFNSVCKYSFRWTAQIYKQTGSVCSNCFPLSTAHMPR